MPSEWRIITWLQINTINYDDKLGVAWAESPCNYAQMEDF